MRVEIEAQDRISAGKEFPIRAVLFNDSYEPVVVSRNAFIGPGVREPIFSGLPKPLAVEPTYGHEEEMLTLQPFSFYGRERLIGPLPVGEVEVTASYQSGVTIAASKRLRIEPD